jgi:hypothetical protein
MANAMLLPYGIIIFLTSVSAFLSLLMIMYILSSQKRYHQYYHIICLLLSCADLIQSSSWWLAYKYETSVTTCLIQEYLLQGSSLVKITITAILSTVTFTILQTKNKLSKFLFYLYFFGWMVFPLFCMPLSIYFSTGSIYCEEDKDDSHHHFLAYYLTILTPFLLLILFNTIIYLIIRSRLFSMTQTQTNPNPHDVTLVHLILKLNTYPIIFTFCWSIEIAAVFVAVLFHQSNEIVDYIGIFLISLTGPLVTALYFYYERKHLQVLFQNSKDKIQKYFQSSINPQSEFQLHSHQCTSSFVTYPLEEGGGAGIGTGGGARANSSAESFGKMKSSPQGERVTWGGGSILSIALLSPSPSPDSDPLLETDLVED